MKVFATFLPQFHQIPENDEWWGVGFTEWDNVKGAMPLYKGHKQPKHPLDYYDLTNKETVVHQTELMEEYGVDGLMYYHYWFKGKLLLEKPAENLLKWKDINQPFFFCWANHNWYKAKGRKKKLLLDVNYGNREDWEKHFMYLLPFFTDDRYEKKDNRPLFMIYKPDFLEKESIIDYFDKRCREEGFDGICAIESYDGGNIEVFKEKLSKHSEYVYYREPSVSQYLWAVNQKNAVSILLRKIKRVLRAYSIYKKPMILNGRELFNLKMRHDVASPTSIHGVCFEWDNTPRHQERGYIITDFEKESFLEYFKSIKSEDYFIVNAWNEWAEGMFLEPSLENGEKYLEWIKAAKKL